MLAEGLRQDAETVEIAGELLRGEVEADLAGGLVEVQGWVVAEG